MPRSPTIWRSTPSTPTMHWCPPGEMHQQQVSCTITSARLWQGITSAPSSLSMIRYRGIGYTKPNARNHTLRSGAKNGDSNVVGTHGSESHLTRSSFSTPTSLMLPYSFSLKRIAIILLLVVHTSLLYTRFSYLRYASHYWLKESNNFQFPSTTKTFQRCDWTPTGWRTEVGL